MRARIKKTGEIITIVDGYYGTCKRKRVYFQINSEKPRQVFYENELDFLDDNNEPIKIEIKDVKINDDGSVLIKALKHNKIKSVLINIRDFIIDEDE